MKVDIPLLLQGFGTTLMVDVLPALGGSYLTGSVGSIALGLRFAAEEFDRAAEALVADNAEIRALFADAAAWVTPPALAARLAAAASSVNAGLRVSVLQAGNDSLNALLIDLHTHIEHVAGPQARALERRILIHLQASAQRAALDIPAY